MKGTDLSTERSVSIFYHLLCPNKGVDYRTLGIQKFLLLDQVAIILK